MDYLVAGGQDHGGAFLAFARFSLRRIATKGTIAAALDFSFHFGALLILSPGLMSNRTISRVRHQVEMRQQVNASPLKGFAHF